MNDEIDLEIPSDEVIEYLMEQLVGSLPDGLEDVLSKRSVTVEESVRLMFLSRKFQAIREERNLDIKSLAIKIKSPQYKIKAIESGDMKQIEPSILKKASSLLGLDDWCLRWAAVNSELAKRLGIVSERYFT